MIWPYDKPYINKNYNSHPHAYSNGYIFNASRGYLSSQTAFKTIRLIVTFGWAIYPIGYFLAYLGGGTNDSETLNIVYNLADLVNKAAFGLAIWVAAISDSE